MTAKALVQTLVEIYGRIGDFNVTPCDGAIPVSEADRLAEEAVEDYTNAILNEERAAIVAWLRSQGGHHDDIYAEVADDIEDGAHHGKATA